MIYLDSSALTRLVVSQAETSALTGYLRSRGRLTHVFSSVSRWEVVFAVWHVGPGAVAGATRLLDSADLMEIHASGPILRAADQLSDRMVWWDAVHLASALSLRPSIAALVSYEPRLIDAATRHEVPVVTPR